MPDIESLSSDEWPKLRDIRLAALQDSPDNFLATYALEEKYDEARWRAEFIRGSWSVGYSDGQPVSLVGITREPETPMDQCYLEYVWVAPSFRHRGVAFEMLNEVLSRLKKSGVRTVFLWVLDGNDAAMRLYRRVGFTSNNHRQPLAARPGRSEERLRLELS
jgi:ribosomal protein S18 acetylase RimI-like enzyme